jgi:FemAB-related protein (PEP-CTERM system-associated)
VSADITREEWDAYVDAHADGTANHLWAWRHVYEAAFRHRTEYLAARRPDGRIVGVLPLVVFEHWMCGRFMVSLPFVNNGGVLADDHDIARGLIQDATERAKWHRMSHVELRHRTPQFGDLPIRRHKVSMMAPLAGSIDGAWEALDRKVRNQVRKAEKSGLTTEVGSAELLPEFYAVFAENMRDLGTPVYPRRWFEEILLRFPERSRVFLVRHDRQAIAGAVTLGYRDSLEVPSAASLRSHRQMCPNMLLYWRIMQQAVADGVRVLDFGRSTPGEGTYKFKEQWGAVPGPMAWEYVLLSRRTVPDRSPANSRFQHAISMWQHLPLGVANTVGPNVVRFLP